MTMTATKTTTCGSTSYFGETCKLSQGHSKRHTWDTNDYRRKKWEAKGKATAESGKGTILAGSKKASTKKARKPSTPETTTPATASSEVIDVVFSFDTTGSMYACLDQVRSEVAKLVGDLFKDIPDLRIGIIAHGDYCDAHSPYVTKHLPLSRDVSRITNFVKTVAPTHGGDGDECYELVLNEARTEQPWETGRNKVLVMIGDASPHEPGYRYGSLPPLKLNWRDEADALAREGVSVYTVQCMGHRSSRSFYESVAKRTNGYHLELDKFEEIRDLIRAVCYKQQGDEALENFERAVEHSGRMSSSLSKIFSKLLERDVTTDKGTGDGRFSPVERGRFRVINVNSDAQISDLVRRHGLTFATGRGFYEFTKSATIQNHKEIVMRDDETGAMFTGADARELLGLPAHCSAVLKPEQVKKLRGENVTVFIQSTSNNRKLLAGTQFLYEV